MTLYDIDNAIMSCVDQETGEIIDLEWLKQLQMERNKKIENVLLWIKNLKAEAEAIKEEENALAARRKANERKIASLTEYVQYALGGENFKTAKVAVSWRTSDAVIVDDIRELTNNADDYLTYKEPEPNKNKIKAAIKSGINVPGCHLEERHNMTIK